MAEFGVQTGSHGGSPGENKVHARRGQEGAIACARCVLMGQATVTRQRKTKDSSCFGFPYHDSYANHWFAEGES